MKASNGKIASLESHNDIPKTRRFTLHRIKDVSGNSGTGHVAVGIIFPSGHCIIEWNSVIKSHSIFHSLADLERVHHILEGHTVIHWIDQ
jgi:hypothetical protein